MDITSIDPNFRLTSIKEQDVEWHEVSEKAFSLHGVFFDEPTHEFIRMPVESAKAVNGNVRWLSRMTAGGRLRFQTDSPYVAVQCIAPCIAPMNHMPLTGSHGFGLLVDGVYRSMYAPDYGVIMRAIEGKSDRFAFEGLRETGSQTMSECLLCFPLYGGVSDLKIGVKKGCRLQAAREYTYSKPVVFYGSSITQGGCASYAGSDYINLLSQWLDFDYVNLGFSGNGKAEPVMCEYLANLHAAAYVLDYDYNAPNAEYLQKTHYPLYETVRKVNPNAPIVFVCKPDYDYDPESDQRRAIIYQTYCKAKAQGDGLVWFIDGEGMFGSFERNACSVDTCHPTNLGFYRMAKTIAPVLRDALKNIEK